MGLFIGNELCEKKNWEGIREKVESTLSKWKSLLPQLSYRGRALIANNLAASSLWHKLLVLVPPAGLVKDVQLLL